MDRLFLEVIAKRPVAEHFEHRVVVCIDADFFQIVVFSRNAKAFLGIGDARTFRRSIAKEKFLELRHARIVEHQRRVVFEHDWRRRHDQVAFALEKIEKLFSYVL
jgi:hypothetical protein